MTHQKLTVEDLIQDVSRLWARLDDLDTTSRLHTKDVMARYGISKATLYRWLGCGRLPQPIRISGPLWRRCDLEKHERLRRGRSGRRTRPDKVLCVRPDAGRTALSVRRPS